MRLKPLLPYPAQVAGNILSLRRERWLSPESLGALQGRLLARLLKAAAGTAHYRAALSGLDSGAARLHRLPITEKADIRKRPEAFIAKGHDIRSLSMNQTSGSTGEPVRVYSDAHAMRWRSAFNYMNIIESGISPFDLTAYIHRRAKPTGMARSICGFYRVIELSVFDDEADNFRALLSLRPRNLLCPPSYGAILAALNDRAGRPLRLKSYISGAETLPRAMRKSIEASFSCTVFDMYGNHECGVFAWECPEERRMHVISRAFLEVVDESGRPLRSGSGHILATPLHNLAMPLIRYRVGDIGRLGGECPCGRGLPVIGAVEGRADDLLLLPDGRLRSAMCLSNIDSMNACSSLFQVVQESPARFTVRYVPGPLPLGPDVRRDVSEKIRRACLGAPVDVGFEEVERIPPGQGGKFRKFVSRARMR